MYPLTSRSLLTLFTLPLFACTSAHFVLPPLATTPLTFARQTDPLPTPWTFPTTHPPAIAFTSDNRLLALRDGSQIHLWNLQTRKRFLTLTESTGTVRAIALTPDGTTLISADTQTLKFWDLHSGQPTQTLPLAGPIDSFSLSPDGRTLAVAGSTLQLWDVVSRQPLDRVANMPACGFTHAVTFFPNSQAIAYVTIPEDSESRRDAPPIECRSGTEPASATIEVRQIQTGHVTQRIPIQSHVRSLAVDGQTVVAALTACQGGDCYPSGENAIKAWNVQTGQPLYTLAPGSISPSIALSGDGKTLASTTLDGVLQLWDLTTGTPQPRLSEMSSGGWGFRVAFSPGNQLTILQDNAVILR